MDLPQNIATNISIPFIGAIVATITGHPEVAAAWLGISQTYLFLKAMDPRADDFMDQVNKHVGGISETLVKSTEFQQSLLVTFDVLIRTRGEKRRDIIRNAYLNGYLRAEDKQAFELERIYTTSQEISLEAIAFLRFIKTEILPGYLAHVESENGLPSNVGKPVKTTRNTSISPHILSWITSNYDVTNNEVKKKYPNLLSDNELYGKLSREFTTKMQEFDDISAELLNLGMFKAAGNTYDGKTQYTFTSFGLRYLEFLEELEHE